MVDQLHPPFVTIYEPMCGWKCVMYVWNPEMGGFYEPEMTGFFGYATPEEAIAEGKMMAECEGVEFRYPQGMEVKS